MWNVLSAAFKCYVFKELREKLGLKSNGVKNKSNRVIHRAKKSIEIISIPRFEMQQKIHDIKCNNLLRVINKLRSNE